jgi:RNA polymerase sigma factor (sigma-70 family)
MKFEELVKKLAPKLKAIAIRLNGKYTVFDHDDLYQEALVYLWQEWQKGEICDKTDSFILQGCFYFLKNYIRKAYKKIDSSSVSLNESLNEANEVLEDVLSLDNMDRVFEPIEERLLVEDVERNLNKREKEILSLLLEGFTTREIGKRFGISHVMVVKIKKRIRNKCRLLRNEIISHLI